MKKLFSLLLAAMLLLTVGNAFAADVELDKTVTTGTTTVSLNVDSTADSYTFTIPASVVIDPTTQYGYGDVTLKAGWELVSVNSVTIHISNVANGVKEQTYTDKVNKLDFESA